MLRCVLTSFYTHEFVQKPNEAVYDKIVRSVDLFFILGCSALCVVLSNR